jgi:arylsulfatase
LALQPSFPLTAKIEKLTIKMNRPQLTPEDIAKLEEAQKAASDAN